MATSVSSERAFSQGGLTISKLRSRLKGDIVEALQVLKCMIRKDLIFRAPEPSSKVEVDYEDTLDDTEAGQQVEDTWDTILDDSSVELP